MAIHNLKIKGESFDAIWRGAKKAEFRLDGVFQVGDELRLHEWHPQETPQMGRQISAVITHVEDCSGLIAGGDPPWVMLSLDLTDKGEGLFPSQA